MNSAKHVWLLPLVLICLTCLSIVPGYAKQIGTPGEGVFGSIDLTFSYGALFRVENQDSDAVGITNPNWDDGNRNFDTGLVSSMFKILAELELRTELDGATVGFFGRGFAFYDTNIVDETNDHDSPATNNNNAIYGGSLGRNNEFTDKTEGLIGKSADKLDAFLFGNFFNNSDHPLSIKLGWQVVSWGESLFIQNGISSVMTHADISKAALPGTELKEIFLPVNQVSSSLAITDSIAINAYYQFDWEKTVAPPVGSYFSQNDWIGDGSQNILLPFVTPGIDLDRAPNDDPDDSGQWGVSLNWFSEALNDTEFSFIYLNYHRKLPDVVFINGGGVADNPNLPPVIPPGIMDRSQYQLKHFDDVKLLGIAFNTTLPAFLWFETAFSGEMAYHEDIPIQTTGLQPGLLQMLGAGPGSVTNLSTREDVITAQVTFNEKVALPILADDITLLAEIGMVYTPDLDDGEFFRGATPGDQLAWGYKAKLMCTYFEAFGGFLPILSGTDLDVTYSFNHDVDGISAIPAGSFTNNQKSFGIKFDARWQNVLTVSLGYNMFFGNGDDNPIADRDNITFGLKYLY